MGKIPQKKSMVSADALSILGSISSFLEQAGFENSGKGLEQDCERIGVTALPKERRGRLSPLDKILSEALESILAAKTNGEPVSLQQKKRADSPEDLIIQERSSEIWEASACESSPEKSEHDSDEASVHNRRASSEEGEKEAEERAAACSPEKSQDGSDLSSLDDKNAAADSTDDEVEQLLPHSFNNLDLNSGQHRPLHHRTVSAVQARDHDGAGRSKDTASCSAVLALRHQQEGRRHGRFSAAVSSQRILHSRALPVARLCGHREPLISLQFVSPSSTGIALPSSSSTIFSASPSCLRLWNVGEDPRGDCLALVSAAEPISAVATLEGGRYAAVGTSKGELSLLDMLSGTSIQAFVPASSASEGSPLLALSVGSPTLGAEGSDGPLPVERAMVAAGSRENEITLWDSRCSAPALALSRSRAIRGALQGLHFLPSSALLLAVGSSSTVTWDLRHAHVISTLHATPEGGRGAWARGGGARAPSNALFLPRRQLVLAEYGSLYAARHRPPPPARIALHSPYSGECCGEYALGHGTPSVGGQFCTSPDETCLLHPVPGGGLSLSALQGVGMPRVEALTFGTEGARGPRASEEDAAELHRVAWNPSGYPDARVLWAASDMDGGVWVWGTEQAAQERHRENERQLRQARRRIRQAADFW